PHRLQPGGYLGLELLAVVIGQGVVHIQDKALHPPFLQLPGGKIIHPANHRRGTQHHSLPPSRRSGAAAVLSCCKNPRTKYKSGRFPPAFIGNKIASNTCTCAYDLSLTSSCALQKASHSALFSGPQPALPTGRTVS